MTALLELSIGFVLALLSARLVLGRWMMPLCLAFLVCLPGVVGAQTTTTRSYVQIGWWPGSGMAAGNSVGVGFSLPSGATSSAWDPAPIPFLSAYDVSLFSGSNDPLQRTVETVEVDLTEFDGYWQGTFWIQQAPASAVSYRLSSGTGYSSSPYNMSWYADTAALSGTVTTAFKVVVIVYDSANDRHVEFQGAVSGTVHGDSGDSGASSHFIWALPVTQIPTGSWLTRYTFLSPILSSFGGVGYVNVYLPEHSDSAAASSSTQPASTQPDTSSGIVQDINDQLLDPTNGVLGGIKSRQYHDIQDASQGLGGLNEGISSFTADSSWGAAADDLCVVCEAISPGCTSSHFAPKLLAQYFDGLQGLIQYVFQAIDTVETQYATIFAWLKPFVTLMYVYLIAHYTLSQLGWAFRWLGAERAVIPGVRPDLLPMPTMGE
jgi:hypothetical protein